MLQRCQVGSCPVRSPVKSRIFDVTAVNTSGHIPACLAPRQPCLKIPPTSKFLHHFSPAFVRMTWTLYAYAIILIPLGACDYQCRSAKKSIRRSNHFKWQPFKTKSWNYFRFDLTQKKTGRQWPLMFRTARREEPWWIVALRTPVTHAFRKSRSTSKWWPSVEFDMCCVPQCYSLTWLSPKMESSIKCQS